MKRAMAFVVLMAFAWPIRAADFTVRVTADPLPDMEQVPPGLRGKVEKAYAERLKSVKDLEKTLVERGFTLADPARWEVRVMYRGASDADFAVVTYSRTFTGMNVSTSPGQKRTVIVAIYDAQGNLATVIENGTSKGGLTPGMGPMSYGGAAKNVVEQFEVFVASNASAP